MSELLTTGEMIDRLKVGEVAVGDVIELGTEIKVFKDKIGHIKSDDSRRLLELSAGIVGSVKWCIIPNYVSFAEAMKAIEDGKDVHCQYNDETITIKSYNNKIGSICFDRHCESGGGAAIKIGWIVAGKWTIEEGEG